MTDAQLHSGIRARFKALVADVAPVTTINDNEPKTAPTDGSNWCRFTIRRTASRRLTCSPAEYRQGGIAFAQLFGPAGKGDGELLELAGTILRAFQGQTAAGVKYKTVTVGPIITVSAAAADNSFNDSGAGLGSLVANQWIYVTGFTTPANNGFFKIVTKAAGKITVSGGTLVDEVAGDSVTIKQGGYIANGTTLKTYNIERKYTDLSSELALFTGMAFNGMNIAIPQEGDVTIGFDLIGGGEQSLTATGGSGYTPATTTEKFNGLDMNAFLENQAAITLANFSLNIGNNLRTRLVIGSSGVLSIGSGNINVSGSLRAYYTSKALLEGAVKN